MPATRNTPNANIPNIERIQYLYPNRTLNEVEIFEHYKKVYIVLLADLFESLEKQEHVISQEARNLTSNDKNRGKLATILGEDNQIASSARTPSTSLDEDNQITIETPSTSFKSLKEYIKQEQADIKEITNTPQIEVKIKKLKQEFKNLSDPMIITLNDYPKASFFKSMKLWVQNTLNCIFGRKIFSPIVKLKQTAMQIESTVEKTIDKVENTVSKGGAAFWIPYDEEPNLTSSSNNNKQETNKLRRNTI